MRYYILKNPVIWLADKKNEALTCKSNWSGLYANNYLFFECYKDYMVSNFYQFK